MDLGLLSRVLRAKLAIDFRSEQTIQGAAPSASLATNVARSSVGAMPQPLLTRSPVDEPNTTRPASISPTGKLVSQLLSSAPARDVEQVITSIKPIVDAAEMPPLIAKALARVVSESGLFYESHVVEWALGKRGHADLLREPQARLTDPQILPRALSDATPSVTAPSSTRDNLHSTTDDQQPGPDTSSRHGERTAVDTEARSGTSAADQKLGADTARMVRHQLDALAADQIIWCGMLRPGERGEIEIAREHQTHAGETLDVWRARLALELPRLGRVEVAITLDTGNLSLAFRAADATRSTLADHATALRNALSAQDLRVQGVRFLDPKIADQKVSS
jgi:Flagellar hook-length control protein FliK